MRFLAAIPAVAAVVLLAGCDAGSPPLAPVTLPEFAVFGEWSAPILLDAAVNSDSAELSPSLSPDKLRLYFNSNRIVPGIGPVNIFVARRDCLECPWQQAQPLPAPVNSAAIDGIARMSHDGHLLFWSSNREGSVPLADGAGLSSDIWFATRKNPMDDFGWETAVPVSSAPGCEGSGRVNTEEYDAPGAYIVAAPGGPALLYFSRGNTTTYQVLIDREGRALGCATEIVELGLSNNTSVRADGRELVFWAGAERGGLGGSDHWTSTRPNINAPWSEPVNMGAPINFPGPDLSGTLSHDGTTFVWASGQARGGLGRQDIWIATRARGR